MAALVHSSLLREHHWLFVPSSSLLLPTRLGGPCAEAHKQEGLSHALFSPSCRGSAPVLPMEFVSLPVSGRDDLGMFLHSLEDERSPSAFRPGQFHLHGKHRRRLRNGRRPHLQSNH